jgi:hypothetical protein
MEWGGLESAVVMGSGGMWGVSARVCVGTRCAVG